MPGASHARSVLDSDAHDHGEPSTDARPSGDDAESPAADRSAAVRAPLERVLASPLFSASERLSRFLRFAVEQVLEGHGDRLKEYVLGVEVFDRDERYDPRLDSIVRVEARRLRSSWQSITHPPAPPTRSSFDCRRAATCRRSSSARIRQQWPARPSFDLRRISWLVTAAVALTIPGSGVLAVRWGRDSASTGRDGIALAVLPFVDHGGVPPHLPIG